MQYKEMSLVISAFGILTEDSNRYRTTIAFLSSQFITLHFISSFCNESYFLGADNINSFVNSWKV